MDIKQLKPNAVLESIESFIPGMTAFGLKLLAALVLFAVGSRMIKFFYSMLSRSFTRMDMEVSLRKFLLSVLKAAMYGLLGFAIAGKLGFNTAYMAALLGSASIAIGLAVQGSLANFAGGMLILLMKPFRVGDYIVAKDGEGTVRTIGLVYTMLDTTDNRQIVIPNATLANSPLANVTAMNKRRIDIKIAIGYGSNLKLAKEIMKGIYTNHPAIRKDDPIGVYVDELGASSVMLGGFGWVEGGGYWPAKWDIMEQILLKFEEAGIKMPANQLDVHIKEENRE